MRPHRRDELGVGLEAVAGDEPGGAQHPERVVRERHLRGERRAEALGRQVGGAAERIDELGLGGSSSAMALTVKSRRARSSSMSVAERDLRLAGVRARTTRPGGW